MRAPLNSLINHHYHTNGIIRSYISRFGQINTKITIFYLLAKNEPLILSVTCFIIKMNRITKSCSPYT